MNRFLTGMSLMDPAAALLLGTAGLALMLWVFWPQKGLFSRWQQYRRMTSRVYSEDALKHLYGAQLKSGAASVEEVAEALQLPASLAAGIMQDLAARELVADEAGQYHLTGEGKAYALNVIRAHRLWERHLAEETGWKESEWHTQAERIEHLLTPEQTDALAAQLGHPTHDPHGDPIPTADGQIASPLGQPLTSLAPGLPARIVHIEDEPETVYAQVVALGLFPGTIINVVAADAQRIRFFANGEEQVVAPLVAANLTVAPLPQDAPVETAENRCLHRLGPGYQARVVRLSPRCRGAERRRFMDLGILPGTLITAEMTGPGGDPTAYRIRGAVIALRKDQARLIEIENLEEQPA